MRKVLITCTIVLYIFTPLVLAKDVEGRFATFGLGAEKCQIIINSQSIDSLNENQQLKSWVSGYFSAINLMFDNTYNIIGKTSLDGINSWLRQYCAQNENDLVITALTVLTQELYQDRVNFSPETKGMTWDKWTQKKDSINPDSE